MRELIQELCKLFVDGSSNENGSGAGIILIVLEGHRFHTTLRFVFDASNNEAEYEVLLAGVRVAKEFKENEIQCFIDSQLVVNHVLGEYKARGIKMEACLAKVKTELSKFEFYSIEQVPHEHNTNADALAQLATKTKTDTLNVVPVEFLATRGWNDLRRIDLDDSND
ncbi:uncharacterized protein LOC133825076 [Humulus lupulus]|uniref:uncharacterized protein LOC133825076 n=1 Tax=Humulus lupulus TaxID=3486 RepID=UPI002B40397C|nr:uncharacterized protein LOC133825076 [Humulus lupulus]